MTNVNYLKEIAKNCADVEFYTSETMSYPTTDNVRSVDVDFDELKENVVCNFYEMDEEQYNSTICANCEAADFDMFFDDKNAKVLVIVLDADHPFRKGEGDNVWDCYSQVDGEKTEKEESGLDIEDARKWLRDRLYAVSERCEQYMSFEEAEADDTVSTARDEDGEVYCFNYDNKYFYIKREDEA